MTTNIKTRGNRITGDQKMIAGTQKFLTQLATLPVGAKNMTPADIVTVFQNRINAATAAQTADAARTAAVKADLDERANTSAFAQAFRRIVTGMFQEAPDTLAFFGLTAPKVRQTKVATKAAAVAKNKATRLARGTVGPKKKLAIKGTVPTANGAVSAPATPAPAPAPAIAATPVAVAAAPKAPVAAPAAVPAPEATKPNGQ